MAQQQQQQQQQLANILFTQGPFYIQAQHRWIDFFFAPEKTTFEYTFTCPDLPETPESHIVKGTLQIRQIETNCIKVNNFFIVFVSNRKAIFYFTSINNIKLARGKELICRADMSKEGNWVISAPQTPSWNIMRMCWTTLSGMVELGLLSTAMAQDIVVGFQKKNNKYQLYLNTMTKELLSEKDEVLLHVHPIDKPLSIHGGETLQQHDEQDYEDDETDMTSFVINNNNNNNNQEDASSISTL